MIHASAKFIVLDKIIDELVVKQKKKVLVFSGFTRMLDCCEDFLSLRGGAGEQFKYVRLDGSTSRGMYSIFLLFLAVPRFARLVLGAKNPQYPNRAVSFGVLHYREMLTSNS